MAMRITKNGVRLFIEPINEIRKLHGKSHRFENEYIGNDINNKLLTIKSPFLHIKAKFEIVNASNFGLNINGYAIDYQVSSNMLNHAFLPLQNRQLDLEVIVDKTLIEVYANGGLIYWFASNNKGDTEDFKISVYQHKNGLNPDPKTFIKSLEIHELKSIWE